MHRNSTIRGQHNYPLIRTSYTQVRSVLLINLQARTSLPIFSTFKPYCLITSWELWLSHMCILTLLYLECTKGVCLSLFGHQHERYVDLDRRLSTASSLITLPLLATPVLVLPMWDHSKGWYLKDGSTVASTTALQPTTYPAHRYA